MSVQDGQEPSPEEVLAAVTHQVEQDRNRVASDPAARLELANSLNALATMLNAVGQVNEAVKPAEEAVELRRALANETPDTTPDLALALNTLATMLGAAERFDEALMAAQEGVSKLKPFFEHAPEPFAPLMRMLCADYVRYAQGSRQQPDAALLEPIVELFKKLPQA